MNKDELLALRSSRPSGFYTTPDALVASSERLTRRWRDWKDRLSTTDRLYRGEITFIRPDGTSGVAKHTANLVQTGLDDLSRLVAETPPSIRIEHLGASQADEAQAELATAVAATFRRSWRLDEALARFAFDAAGSGGAFAAIWPADPYPRFVRLDPRGAYPDFQDDELVSLLYITRTLERSLAIRYPDAPLDPDPSSEAEVTRIDYYGADECISVAQTRTGVVELARSPTPGGVVPVAWGRLATHDGDFRGVFDQVENIVTMRNQILSLVLEYHRRQVYSPLVVKGSPQGEMNVGPNAVVYLDTEGEIGYLGAPGSSPQLYAMVDILDREGRFASVYPATRQGEISQAVASARFVESTLGERSTLVRAIHRVIADLIERAVGLGFSTDAAAGGEKRPLLAPASKRKDWTPDKLPESPLVSVTFGAGSGLDSLNRGIKIERDLLAQLISRRMAREQTDYIDDPDRVERDIERERVRESIFRAIDQNPALAARFLQAVEDGEDVVSAFAKAQLAVEEAQAQQQQQAAGPAPGPEAIGPETEGPPGESPLKAVEAGGTTPAPAFPPLQELLGGR